MNNFYNMAREACARRGKTITRALNDIGRADGSTGSWKAGRYPRLNIVMELAEYLDMSLDELCYGPDSMRARILDDNDREWLSIVSRIPQDRQEMCKAFLRTHMVEPDKYVDKKEA